MTLEQEATKHMASVMMAYAEGKQIEFKRIDSHMDLWFVAVKPTWDWSKFQYRIRPNVPEYVEKSQTDDIIQDLEKRVKFLESKFGIEQNSQEPE